MPAQFSATGLRFNCRNLLCVSHLLCAGMNQHEPVLSFRRYFFGLFCRLVELALSFRLDFEYTDARCRVQGNSLFLLFCDFAGTRHDVFVGSQNA